jgi:hypothetical protein
MVFIMLISGVPNVINASTNQTFDLKAHLIIGCGDWPALSKLLCVTGHSGRHPCRSCTIQASWSVLNHHYYIAMSCPEHLVPYDPRHLPLRTEQDTIKTWRILEAVGNNRQLRGMISKATGITKASEVFSVHTLQPFCSFPIDLIILQSMRDVVQFAVQQT